MDYPTAQFYANAKQPPLYPVGSGRQWPEGRTGPRKGEETVVSLGMAPYTDLLRSCAHSIVGTDPIGAARAFYGIRKQVLSYTKGAPVVTPELTGYTAAISAPLFLWTPGQHRFGLPKW